jgi:hypothetical protein
VADSVQAVADALALLVQKVREDFAARYLMAVTPDGSQDEQPRRRELDHAGRNLTGAIYGLAETIAGTAKVESSQPEKERR